jgi:hypothetical protein
MEYLRGNHDQPLVLGADNNGLLMWYVDTSFAMHPNMRGHTGGGLTMGRGFPILVLTKQKLNMRSSTESELVGVNDMMLSIFRTCYFLSQGYGIIKNLLLQDNKSSILLEQNGMALSGKRTSHVNIQYFFITDQVNMKVISIDWCPTKKMVADFMTKPLEGNQFRELRDYIMSRVRCITPKADVINLGRKKPSKKLVKKSSANGKRRIIVTGNKSWGKVLTQ